MQACEEQVRVCAHLRTGWILLVCLNIIADIVSGDVEPSVYASEYSKYNCFLFEVFTFLEFFLMGWMCVYDYAFA